MRAEARAAEVSFTTGRAPTARTHRATWVKDGREPDREIKHKKKRTEHLDAAWVLIVVGVDASVIALNVVNSLTLAWSLSPSLRNYASRLPGWWCAHLRPLPQSKSCISTTWSTAQQKKRRSARQVCDHGRNGRRAAAGLTYGVISIAVQGPVSILLRVLDFPQRDFCDS